MVDVILSRAAIARLNFLSSIALQFYFMAKIFKEIYCFHKPHQLNFSQCPFGQEKENYTKTLFLLLGDTTKKKDGSSEE